MSDNVTCRICRVAQPMSSFQKDPKARNGRQSRCTDCTAAYARELRARKKAGGPRLKSGYNPRPVADRLWGHAIPEPNTGCWIWMGAVDQGGYGKILLGCRRLGRAHRIAWQLTNGPIPNGLLVCHRCDNRLCINPAHMFLGTHLDNMADMTKKRRYAKKLTEDDVMLIRNMGQSGVLHRDIALAFGVSRSNVDSICAGRTWST